MHASLSLTDTLHLSQCLHETLEDRADDNRILSLDLQGMGFSKTKAKEALEECHYRLDMAVEWLVSHCV